MRTRNSYYPNNSPVTILRRRNRRRAPNVVEPELRTIVEVAPMAENRTMEELLQAPTEGYGEAIVIPEINADHFEIKTNLLQLNDQDSLNAATGGNLLSKTTRDALNIIENKSKVRYSRNKPNVSRESSSKTDDRIDKLADQISTLVEIVSKKVVTPLPINRVFAERVLTISPLQNRASKTNGTTLLGVGRLRLCKLIFVFVVPLPWDSRGSVDIVLSMQNSQNRYNQNQSQGNNFNQGNNFYGNQGFQVPINHAPNIQNQGFQNQPFQAPNNQVQQGFPNEFSNYMKSNDQMMRNMQNHIIRERRTLAWKSNIMKTKQTILMNQQNAFQNNLQNMLSGFFQNQASTLGTLSSNTIPNPKGEMKAITTRSGAAYEGPSIPTNPSPKKVVERETEETTDKEQTNF
ncbi:hypothetical protein Tco_0216310 [Tanacetum coccineum]